MKIAYATTFNIKDVHNWSGTPFYMSKALSELMTIDYINDLSLKLPPFFKAKQIFSKYLCGKRESPRFNKCAAQHYSAQVDSFLNNRNVDAIVSPLINPIAYLETNKPVILWTDAVYSSLLGFYPAFNKHSDESIRQGNSMTMACLSKARLAIFSSDWAANSAIQLYGISRDKVKVVNFGANIDEYPNANDIREIIKKRSTKKIKLLFLAKSWERKGGDIVLKVAQALHEQGHAVELNIVGITPKLNQQFSYINCLGYISKKTAEGKKRLHQLLSESHFLFLPCKADACPMVLAEANAYGLPCITSHVGGIATIIKNDVNGQMFGLDVSTEKYCDYIVNLFSSRARYEELALSAYNEYVERLNWGVATKKVEGLIREVL